MSDILILSENEHLHRTVLKAVSKDWACSIFSTRESLEVALTLRQCELLFVDLDHRDIDDVNDIAQLSAAAECPAVALSEQVTEATRIAAYEVGVEDVFAHASSVDLIKAKVHRLLHKKTATDSSEKIPFGQYQLDKERHQVIYGNMSVKLSRKERDILLLLIQANGIPLSVHDIIEKVWRGQTTYPGAVAVYIQRLRKKLDFGADPQSVIENIHGLGYSIHVDNANFR